MSARTQALTATALLLAGVGLGVFLQRAAFSGGTPNPQPAPQGDDKDKAPFLGRALVAGFFPEGPCFTAGKLFYADYTAHRVLTWDGRNATQLWHRDKTGPCAILPWKDDTLLVACNDDGSLRRLRRSGEEILPPVAGPEKARFNGPNDLAADPCGGVYFTTSGTWTADAPAEGKVFYLSPEGKVTQVADGIHYANGLAVVNDKDGAHLLVAEMLQGRVLQYTIGKDGRLSGRSVWRQLADIRPGPREADWSTGPDGIKIDSRGNVYICHFGASRILVTSPDGSLLRTVTVPLKGVTNLAFSPDEEALYVTAVKDSNEPYLGAVYQIPTTEAMRDDDAFILAILGQARSWSGKPTACSLVAVRGSLFSSPRAARLRPLAQAAPAKMAGGQDWGGGRVGQLARSLPRDRAGVGASRFWRCRDLANHRANTWPVVRRPRGPARWPAHSPARASGNQVRRSCTPKALDVLGQILTAAEEPFERLPRDPARPLAKTLLAELADCLCGQTETLLSFLIDLASHPVARVRAGALHNLARLMRLQRDLLPRTAAVLAAAVVDPDPAVRRLAEVRERLAGPPDSQSGAEGPKRP